MRDSAGDKEGGGDCQQSMSENELTAPPARSALVSYSWEFLTPLRCHTAHKNRKRHHPAKKKKWESGDFSFVLSAECRCNCNRDITHGKWHQRNLTWEHICRLACCSVRHTACRQCIQVWAITQMKLFVQYLQSISTDLATQKPYGEIPILISTEC